MTAMLLALTVFVNAATGSDAGDGSAAHPYRMLVKARDAVRALRQSGKFPAEGVTVELTGEFDLAERTLLLDAQDGGPSGSAPVVWRGSADGATLSGAHGFVRSSFDPVSEPAARARLKASVRDRVLAADLDKAGVGPLKPLPAKFPNWSAADLQLYVGGEAMPVARYPDRGWLEITNVIDRGVAPVDPSKDEWEFGVRGGVFEYAGDAPARWDVSKGIWMHGYWCWDWAADSLKIAEIDRALKTIRSEGVHTYGIGMPKTCNWQGRRRYYVYNLLEELDVPGEWYVDREARRLYFLPPPDWDGTARLVVGSAPVVSVRNAAHVVLENLGIPFAPVGVDVRACTNVVLRALAVSGICRDAVRVSGGADCRVEGCRISDIGSSGLVVSGGDRPSLTRCNHRVTRNRVERCGRAGHSGRCLRFSGCGVVVDHNLFRDVPYIAVAYTGNEHLLEYNEIACAVMEAADGGGVYTGRDWGSQGNVVRYNYFHHFGRDGVDWMRAHGRKSCFEPSKDTSLVMGLYLDDCDSGEIVYGNVFERTGRAIFIGGGRWNTVSNNLVIGGSSALHLDTRGLTRAKPGSGLKNGWDLLAKLEDVKFRESPWRERYPWLLNVMSDEPLMPLHNTIVGNVSIGAKAFLHVNDRRIDEAIARTVMRNNVHVGLPSATDGRLFASNAVGRILFCRDAALEQAAENLSAFELMSTERFRNRFPEFPILNRASLFSEACSTRLSIAR